MQKNDLVMKDGKILRVLSVQEETVQVIDCMKKTMPYWIKKLMTCETPFSGENGY